MVVQTTTTGRKVLAVVRDGADEAPAAPSAAIPSADAAAAAAPSPSAAGGDKVGDGSSSNSCLTVSEARMTSPASPAVLAPAVLAWSKAAR